MNRFDLLVDVDDDDDAAEILERAFERARVGTAPRHSATHTPDRGPSPISDLVIGIDFGTTFTGVAYAHSLSGNVKDITKTQAELDAIVDKVVLIKSWPMAGNQNAEKIPTILAYEGGNVSAWGGRVRQTNKTKVEYFKLGLQEGAGEHYRAREANVNSTSLLGGFLDNHNWRHPDLPNKKAVDYVQDYLREIRKHVLQTVLPRQLPPEFLKNERISYALTVPAIWSDKAKDLTRQAAEQAGIPRDMLAIISEPEAAALYCATTCREVSLGEGDCFLICDAGGGTVVYLILFRLLI